MNPRGLLVTAAVLLGSGGWVLLFLPAEVGARLGLIRPGEATVALELFGGALLSVGMLNWLARGAIYGGIYGRPIALADFLFCGITGATLLRVAVRGGVGGAGGALPGLLAVGGAFFLLTVGFGWILFGARPWDDGSKGGGAGRGGPSPPSGGPPAGAPTA